MTSPVGSAGKRLGRALAALALVGVAASCSNPPGNVLDPASRNDGATDGVVGESGASGGTAPAIIEADGEEIVVNSDVVVGAVDPRLLGTNVPAWLLPEFLAEPWFRDATVASGTTLLRLPGGSWSNKYDWLACEQGDETGCEWPWAARPSDLMGFLDATDIPGTWTVSINGTAQEAAALVAFFNGDVDDDRVIGSDRNGRDWLTVGDWARLRSDRGHPEPVPIRLWEVGNEVFGAVAEAGPECASFGWEEVWTCDGTDYVTGTADHDGFLQFRDAMLAVDPDIAVGVVGVGEQSSWNDWGNSVLAAAGDEIDFYVIHHYASNGDLPASEVLDAPRRDWPRFAHDVRAGFERHGLDNSTPIAVTEHNLVSFIDGDDEQLMTTALNAFFLTDTIGQFVVNGVTIANQWNIVNGRAENGTDYGLIDGVTRERSPAYYALLLWSRFGDELVQVGVGDEVDELLIYGGRDDGAPRLLVVNPTDEPIAASIASEPSLADTTVTADVVDAESQLSTTVTYNGSTDPSASLSEPPLVVSATGGDEFRHEFPAYSITLLRWEDGP